METSHATQEQPERIPVRTRLQSMAAASRQRAEVAASSGPLPLGTPSFEEARCVQEHSEAREAATRYYRSLCSILSDLAARGALPAGMPKLFHEGLRTYMDFSRRVDTGYYRMRPGLFRKDYDGLRDCLVRLRAETDSLAHRAGYQRRWRVRDLPNLAV